MDLKEVETDPASQQTTISVKVPDHPAVNYEP
jgi:hypothetical protein